MDIGEKSPKGSSGRQSNASESSASAGQEEDLDPSPYQTGYQLNIIKCLLLYPIAILPVCIGLLLAYWFRARWIKLTCKKCPLVNASYVVVKDLDGKERVEIVRQVVVEKGKNVAGESDHLLESLREKTVVKYIEHRCMRYFYDDGEDKYLLLRGYDAGATCTTLHNMAVGLKGGDHRERLCLYGTNSINVPVKSYPILFVEEVLHPFYIFQLLSISLWMYEHYYSYAVCILVLSTISVTLSLLQTRKNMQQLHDMASHSSQVTVLRDNKVPDNFHETLGLLTQKGLRVIAVGHRTMQLSWHKSERIERDAVERDLTFGGLIAMENTLKPETTPVIGTLMNANIRTVMITGDNLLTGVSVARGCGMIAPEEQAIQMKVEASSSPSPASSPSPPASSPSSSTESLVEAPPPSYAVRYHLLDGVGGDTGSSGTKKCSKIEMVSQGYQSVALTLDMKYHIAIEGSSFMLVRSHFPDLYNKLLVKGTVFARMSPDQKAQLVTDLQTLGYGVCMCGDGANDCGALKAAHAGISLSEAEASVASPFTSKVPNITCVPHLLAEGRAALTTSFSVFKYMALYSLILFSSVSMLYWVGLTGPYSQLARRRPPGSLAGVNVLVSMAIHIFLAVMFQVFALLYLHGRAWYTPAPIKNTPQSEETIVIFLFLIFQYVCLSVTLSTGPPYRQPLYTNVIFMLCLLVIVPCNIYLTLAPADWAPGLWNLLQMTPFPYLFFRLGILELVFLYFLLTYLLESYVFHSTWWHTVLRVIRCKKKPFNRYKHILASMDPSWPPVESRQAPMGGLWPQVENKK